MQQRQAAGDRLQVERPVEGAVAAADDQHVLVGKILHAAYGVEHRGALVGLDALERRTLRREGAAARGDDDDLGDERLAGVRREPETAVFFARERIDALTEMEGRAEGLDLLHEPIGQLLARNFGERRDVVDRLFGVELGALSADLFEDVDDVGAYVEKAELKYREEAAGAGADDQRVGLDGGARLFVGRLQGIGVAHDILVGLMVSPGGGAPCAFRTAYSAP